KCRKRAPVAAKIAFPMAGAMTVVAGKSVIVAKTFAFGLRHAKSQSRALEQQLRLWCQAGSVQSCAFPLAGGRLSLLLHGSN
ncbi:MAG: hypothetical protein ACK4RZ_16470, partial [Paracoccaceae bacterium]